MILGAKNVIDHFNNITEGVLIRDK